MTHYLVITAVGTDRPGIGNKVIQLVSDFGCNIIDSRIAVLGNEFTLNMLICGRTAQITHVEHSLPQLGQEQDLVTIVKRTSLNIEKEHSFTMQGHIQAIDKVGLTESITQFFAQREIGLNTLSARTIKNNAMESQQPLATEQDQFQVSFTALLSSEYNLMQLQEEFLTLCDSLGIKGTLNFLNNG
jgi:glycine cleavage system transcriptional repressor